MSSGAGDAPAAELGDVDAAYEALRSREWQRGRGVKPSYVIVGGRESVRGDVGLPRVAGLMFHELVGHSSEMSAASPPRADLIGPASLDVSVWLGSDRLYDDEGVRSCRLPLVRAGRVVNRMADRESCVRGSTKPSGLAQAIAHGGKPTVRCTHLFVGGDIR